MAKANTTDIVKTDVTSVLGELGIELGSREIMPAEKLIDGLGYEPVEKDALLGVPFIIINYEFHKSDYADGVFVVVRAITIHKDKVFFSDGSTGLLEQLKSAARNDPQLGFVMDDNLADADMDNASVIVCQNGLRKSDYTYTDPKDGKVKPATTYYIA